MQKRPYIIYIILCIVFLFCFSYISYPQQQNSNISSDSLPNNNKIEFRSEKIANTFTFNGNAFFDLDLDFGNILILQNYRGTSLKTSGSAFRNDELFLFEYEYDIFSDLFLIAKQNWLFSSDSRSLQINQLERLNGKAGLKYLPVNVLYIEATGGIEKNQQIGHSSTGPILNIDAALQQIDVSDYKISSRVFGEYLSLDYDRMNAEINWLADVGRIYDESNSLGASLRYKLLNRDFLNKYTDLEQTDFSVESRLEKRINSVIDLDISLGDHFFADTRINFSKLDVQRQFNQPIADLSISKVYRDLSEIQLGFAGELVYITNKFSHKAGISFDIRNEDNAINSKFDINQQDETRLRSIENRRDNSSDKTEFFLRGMWLLSHKDSIAYDYSVSLFEYDTPSEDNNDDRDEFSSIISLSYFHRFSRYFRAGISGEVQLRHLVFLKAERSALNNWNRIYRINSHFQYQNEFMNYNPNFEILANYTIYDFETVSPSVQSFSYRQVSYRDSLMIFLTKNLTLQSRTILRYYERGVLYWQSFSESPESGGLEKFIKILLIINKNDHYRIGSGLRFYDFMQENLAQGSSLGMGEFSQRSWGPEMLIDVKLDDSIFINMEGWYEYQYLNNNKKRIVPNFFINARYEL